MFKKINKLRPEGFISRFNVIITWMMTYFFLITSLSLMNDFDNSMAWVNIGAKYESRLYLYYIDHYLMKLNVKIRKLLRKLF